MVRPLAPNLFAKIIDACHSGVSYIKDTNNFREYLKSTGGQFNTVYFMFSSKVDQYSYATSELSYFTRSIIEAIYAHTGPYIRYKEIIDFVSDRFEPNTDQTPLFIAQADYTDVFCDITVELKTAIEGFVKVPSTLKLLGNKERHPTSLVEIIAEDAKRYCSQSEANEALTRLKETFSGIETPSPLEELYTFELRQSDHSDVPDSTNSQKIGRWLAIQPSAKALFARPTRDEYAVPVAKPQNISNFGATCAWSCREAAKWIPET